MGTSGVPWISDKNQIIQSLKENDGKLTLAAKSLGVCYRTLRNEIDLDPELIKLVEDLRNGLEETLLDMAEDTIEFAMSNKDRDMANALKGAFFMLNSKGRKRGYSNTQAPAMQAETLASLAEDPSQAIQK